MERTHMSDPEEVMFDLEVLGHCQWYKPGVGFICAAEDIGLESYVECVEKDANRCPFSMSYANSYYCTSYARVYIAKEIEK